MPTSLKRTDLRSLAVILFACTALVASTGAGCGGDGGGGMAGTSGGTAGTTGKGGTGAGGRGGTTGSAGSGGTTGTAGAAGGLGGTAGGAGGRGGFSTPGDAGAPGGAGGRGGAGGTAGGRGGAGGTAGGAGMGGRGGFSAPGDAGTTGSGGRGGAAGSAGSAGRGGNGGSTGGGAGRGGAGGATGGSGGALTNPRIMPLGDSTTASICYRSHLAQMLNSAGKTYNFVGSRNGDPGCSFTNYDKDNEGHGGYIVTDILKAAGSGTRPGGADSNDPFVSDSRDLATWFDGRPADIVLMHFGTNDVWNNIAPASILNAYTAILNKLRMVNPNVRVMVAQITSLQPSGCTDCPTRVQTLNGMIPNWASQNSTASSPISVVDQNTGFNPATDTGDGVHANDAGATKIATKWFNALNPLF